MYIRTHTYIITDVFRQKLATVKANPSRFVSAGLAVNKFKNRLVNILPCKYTHKHTRTDPSPMGAVLSQHSSFIDV